jgi:protein-tyrosine kinase
MSRIYEALQRAERERQPGPQVHVDSDADLHVAQAVEDLAPPREQFDIELVPQVAWNPLASYFPALLDRGPGTEQMRGLRSRIYQARYESPLKTILISSGMPSEGKSFVSVNLAVSLARNSGNNILLIDGDLRHPSLHRLFGTTNEIGLAQYLAGESDLSAVMQRTTKPVSVAKGSDTSIPNLTLIPAGKCTDDSFELVSNRRIEELIANVSTHFDWILIDSPPALVVSDAVDLARAADGVLLLARASRTNFEDAKRTQTTFKASRILGFVLNDMKDAPRQGSYYYYYGKDGDNGKKRR